MLILTEYRMLLITIISGVNILLTGCGGGAGNESPAPPAVIPQPVAPQPTECNNQRFNFRDSSSEGETVSGFESSKAIDGDIAWDSRWESTSANAALLLDLGQQQQLGAITIMWYRGNQRTTVFSVDGSTDQQQWQSLVTSAQSSGNHSGFEKVSFATTAVRYIKIHGLTNSDNGAHGIIEVRGHKCTQADGPFTEHYPNQLGIDLQDWYLSIPTDNDNDGRADRITENQLAQGFTHSEFFFASADGGITMRSPSYGFKTSTNTQYVRVELREMLRRGNTNIATQGVNENNWVFGSASAQNRQRAGGVDADLNVTLAVNKVTTSGESYQVGRVVIGQIHANDDEPIRLYYRKLPNNERGAIYFAHEQRDINNTGIKQEEYIELIGSRANSASNPTDGIALNEVFSYHINVTMNLLTVTLSREGKADVVAHYDMSQSGYDAEDQYHYFKVGVYHLNNSSDPSEFAQATFYAIRNSHTGYAQSE